jgi:hypothetical protein
LHFQWFAQLRTVKPNAPVDLSAAGLAPSLLAPGTPMEIGLAWPLLGAGPSGAAKGSDERSAALNA